MHQAQWRPGSHCEHDGVGERGLDDDPIGPLYIYTRIVKLGSDPLLDSKLDIQSSRLEVSGGCGGVGCYGVFWRCGHMERLRP